MQFFAAASCAATGRTKQGMDEIQLLTHHLKQHKLKQVVTLHCFFFFSSLHGWTAARWNYLFPGGVTQQETLSFSRTLSKMQGKLEKFEQKTASCRVDTEDH